jgi:hypothetical protein
MFVCRSRRRCACWNILESSKFIFFLIRPTWGTYCVTPSNYGLLPQDTSLRDRVEHPGLSLHQTTDFYPRIHRWAIVSSIQAYLRYCVTPSSYGLLPQDTSLSDRVEHPGIPEVLCHSVKLRTSTPWYIIERSCSVEHPGLPEVLCHSVKLRTSTPGYIADRSCRASRPTWDIVSLHQTPDFYPRIHRWDIVSSIQVIMWYCVTPLNYGPLPQDTSLREPVDKGFWPSLAWWRRLHNSVDLWQCVIFRSEVGSHHM